MNATIIGNTVRIGEECFYFSSHKMAYNMRWWPGMALASASERDKSEYERMKLYEIQQEERAKK
jgi:hypothetical protein